MGSARNGDESSALITRPEDERAIVPKEKDERGMVAEGSSNGTYPEGNGVPQQNGTGASDPELRKHIKERKSSRSEQRSKSRDKSPRSKSRDKRDTWRKESGSIVSTERSARSESTSSPRRSSKDKEASPSHRSFRDKDASSRSDSKKSPARARAGAASLKADEDDAKEEDLMKVAVDKTLGVKGQTQNGPYGSRDNLLQLRREQDDYDAESTAPSDFAQTSVQSLLQGSADGAATEICAVLHVSSQMFQDHRHKRLRNLAQVLVHMKQPTKYVEDVPVYLEPVPKDRNSNPSGEQVPAFRVMAGVPLELTVMFDKSVPHVNSRVTAILGIECIPQSTYYMRPKAQRTCTLGWCEPFGDILEPETVHFTPFKPEEVEIDTDELTTAHIKIRLPEEAGPRGELMLMKMKIHFAYERKAPIGVSSAKMSTEQLMYFTVFKNGSRTMQQKDTYQPSQCTLVNATIDMEVVAASAGVLLCPPTDLPMQVNYTSGRGDKYKFLGGDTETKSDTNLSASGSAAGSAATAPTVTSKWAKWNPWSKKADDPPRSSKA